MRCEKILGLRKKGPPPAAIKVEAGDMVKFEEADATGTLKREGDELDGPDPKKSRGMTLEEYEAALDADDAFTNVDPDLILGEAVHKTVPGD